MRDVSRRSLVAASAGGVAALCIPRFVTTAQSAAAAAQCEPAGHPPFLPSLLTVDCASRRNLRAFLQYTDYLGLAGVVSMTFVRTKYGWFPAGNMFLFPWLKPAGQKIAKGKIWPTVVPASATLFMSASPIPGETLPPDEYFVRFVLQAPVTSFIGFAVDVPYSKATAKLAWFSNVDLPGGEAVGIDWTSANLNEPWFDDSHWIPNTATCNGTTWRRLITDALDLAASASC
jgi:hypothetical protein